jgi:hypothetical protein
MKIAGRYKYDTTYSYDFQPFSSEIVTGLSKSGVSALFKEWMDILRISTTPYLFSINSSYSCDMLIPMEIFFDKE